MRQYQHEIYDWNSEAVADSFSQYRFQMSLASQHYDLAYKTKMRNEDEQALETLLKYKLSYYTWDNSRFPKGEQSFTLTNHTSIEAIEQVLKIKYALK